MPPIRPSDAPDLNQPLLAEHERSHTPTPEGDRSSTTNPQHSSSFESPLALEASRQPRRGRTTDDEHEDDQDDTETLGMTGFQRPDRNEISAMVISGTVVVLLSIAAGLTTIFDWVI